MPWLVVVLLVLAAVVVQMDFFDEMFFRLLSSIIVDGCCSFVTVAVAVVEAHTSKQIHKRQLVHFATTEHNFLSHDSHEKSDRSFAFFFPESPIVCDNGM